MIRDEVEFRSGSSLPPGMQTIRQPRRPTAYSGSPPFPPNSLHDSIDLGTVQDLFFKQRLGDLMKQSEIGSQKILGLVITLLNNASDFGVDLDGRAL